MPPAPDAAKWAVKCLCGCWLAGYTNAASEVLVCPACSCRYRKGDLVPMLRHPDPHYTGEPEE